MNELYTALDTLFISFTLFSPFYLVLFYFLLNFKKYTMRMPRVQMANKKKKQLRCRLCGVTFIPPSTSWIRDFVSPSSMSFFSALDFYQNQNQKQKQKQKQKLEQYFCNFPTTCNFYRARVCQNSNLYSRWLYLIPTFCRPFLLHHLFFLIISCFINFR